MRPPLKHSVHCCFLKPSLGSNISLSLPAIPELPTVHLINSLLKRIKLAHRDKQPPDNHKVSEEETTRTKHVFSTICKLCRDSWSTSLPFLCNRLSFLPSLASSFQVSTCRLPGHRSVILDVLQGLPLGIFITNLKCYKRALN